MAEVVAIGKVFPSYIAPTYSVRRMTAVLLKQGQIEPLQVRPTVSGYATFAEDTHGNDILCAARTLGWPTVLITVVPKFIQ